MTRGPSPNQVLTHAARAARTKGSGQSNRGPEDSARRHKIYLGDKELIDFACC